MSADMDIGNVQDGVSNDVVNENGDGDIAVGEEADGLGELEKDLSSRPMHKAKRVLGRRSPGKDLGPAISVGQNKNSIPSNVSKNSKKSRDGRGRGLPKKGGAGGKGVWGRYGDEIGEDGRCHDSMDPNYDSESEEEYLIEAIQPEVTLDELEKVLEPAVLEYYENNSADEFLRSIEDLNFGSLKPKLVEYLISKAMDHKAAHREMTSVLLSELYSRLLKAEDITGGFDELLGKMSDLILDAPQAPEVIGKFIARAVADDCLPPKYITTKKENSECQNSRAAMVKADALLNQKHGIVRLDNIWGTGGGIRPVKSLIKKMVLLLQEYLSSGDIQEATSCLRDLEVPHFHHELVYEAINIVIEKSSDRAAQMMVKYLKSLAESIIVTPDQMNKGFERVYDNMSDICLDVPNAYSLLEKFAVLCQREGVIDQALLDQVPQRGRKRFVSEGDGGKLKE